MADIHNGIKYATGELNALGIAGGLARDQSGVERLGETLTPIMDIWSQPEWAWLRGDLLWVSRPMISAAGAGALSAFATCLPASARLICVVEGAWARSATAGDVMTLGVDLRTTITAVPMATTGTRPRARDNRLVATPSFPNEAQAEVPLDNFTGSSAGNVGIALEQRTVPGVNVAVEFRSVPYVLRPNTGIWIQGSTNNLLVVGGFWGRLRVPLPGELP